MQNLSVLRGALKGPLMTSHRAYLGCPQMLSLGLTLRLGVIVVEVLLPLRCDELAHIPDEQTLVVASAEPVGTEEAF